MASSDIWDGSTDGLWATSSNWQSNPAAVPGAGDTATFSLSAASVNTNTTIDLGSGVTIGAVVFDTSDAAAYTIGAGAAGSQTLTLDTVGNAIILNSTVANNQLFNAKLALATTGTYTFINNSATNSLDLAGGISASSSGIKVMQIDGAGQTNITGAITAGAGSMNLLKTGSGTLVLSGGGAFSGNGVQGNPSGNFPVVLREGTTKITGGTYAVTGEMVLGGVLNHGDPGWNNLLQMDGGTLAVSSWFSVGRGNGTGGVSTDVVLNNDSVLTAGNVSAGYNGGSTSNMPKGSITLNGTSQLIDSGLFILGESDGSNFNMTLNNSAQLQTNEMRVAGNSGLATLTLNGNSSVTTGNLFIARGQNNTSTATGTVYVNPGTTLSSEDIIVGFAGSANQGHLVVDGGTVTVGRSALRWMHIDQWDTAQGLVDINSGALNLWHDSAMRFLTGNTGTSGAGTVNQNGGAVTFYSDNGTTIGGTGGIIDMAYRGSATATSTYNLNGGTLTVGQIISTTANASRTFNFNGGVLKPTGTTANWINLGSGTTALYVQAGGAKIDTNSFDVAIAQPLLDAGGGGGLTKSGAGALTLTGVNTYTGPTNVNAGRLVLNGSIASSSAVNVGSGAGLDLSNATADTLSLNALNLNNSALTLEFVGGVNDQINVAGAVTTAGTSTINLNQTSGALSAGTYTLLTAASGLGSGFTLGSVPAGFFSYSLSASNATTEVLTVSGNPTPAVAYWTGLASSSGADATNKWGFGSTATQSNWSTTADGLSDPLQTPGPSSDVIFTAANATGVSGALNTTLDASYSIKSLTFDVPGSTGITSVGIDTAAKTLTIAGDGVTLAATSNAGATISGAGTVVLNGSQTWANNNASALTVNSAVSAASGTTTLTIGGSGSGDVNIGGAITNGGGTVALVVNKSAGNTNLSGNNTYGGTTTINAGTLNFTGGTTAAGAVTVGGEGGSGVMNIGAGANVTFNGPSTVGYRTGVGTLNITGGTFSTGTNELRVGGSDQNGAANNAAGTLNISGGLVNLGALTVGRGNFLDNFVSGTVNLSGGTLSSTNDVILGFAGTGSGKVAISNTGVFNVGTTATKWMMLGYWDSTSGQVDMSGGALNLNYGSSLVFARQPTIGASSINQTGGSVTSFADNATTIGGTGGIDMQYVGSATFSSTYNLDGGTLSIFRIFSSASSGTRVFNFNGGTLRPVASDAAFMNLGSGSASVNVRNGGAKIDTSGFDVTIASPLLHSTIPGDAATDGGLTKSGAGQLILSGDATYTGPTVVNAGTLSIRKSNSGGGAISVASGAALNLNSTTATGSLAASSMTLDSSTLSFNLGAVFPTDPLYNLSGNLSRSGTNTINLAGAVSSGTVTLIQYAGSETGGGNFTLGALPNRTSGTIFDLGAGKVDVAIVVNALKWTGLGDGSWTTEVQTTKNWVDGATPADYTEGDPVLFNDSASDTTVNLPANVSPAGVTVDNSSQSYTFTGAGGITGNAALAKTGTGTLNIANSGTNSYSGGTTIAAGTVEFNGPSVTTAQTPFLGTGPIVNNGVIRFNRTEDLANEQFSTVFLWNDISGSGSIIASQNGQLGGNNSFDGSVTVQSGATLFLDNSAALGSSVGETIVEDGGRIAMYPSLNLGDERITIAGNGPTYGATATNGAIFSNGNSTIGGTLTLSSNAAIDVNGATLTLNGALAGGSNDLTKNGGGRLIIAGAATFNNTNISGGRLQIGNNGTLGNLGSGNVSMTGGGVDFNRADTYTVANYITGTGVVYNIGSGTVILTNASSDFSGVIGANNGTIILQGAAFPDSILAEGNGTVRVANDNYNFTLSIASINSNNAQTGAMELAGDVSFPFGITDLNFAGRNNATTGLRSVSGNNTLPSNIVLNGGGSEYRIEAAAGATFNITGGISGIGTLGGERNLTFDGAGVGTVSGTISNGGAGTLNIAKAGSGTWTLTASNSYNGNTTVQGGRLVLGNNAQSPVFNGPGYADVQGGRLVFDYNGGSDPASQVLSILQAAAPGNFSTGQIRSSTATTSTTLGWKDDTAASQVIVGYTYKGDANLDGQVDVTDLGALATNWQTSNVWSGGDFNYDGFVDVTDLGALATNWQMGVGSPLGADSLQQALQSVGLGNVSVPEPASLALLGLGLATLSQRRRRRISTR